MTRQPSVEVLTPLQRALLHLAALDRAHGRLDLRGRRALRDIASLTIVRLARADAELDQETDSWRRAA